MTNSSTPELKPIPKYFSVYLDFLRFGAAMFVLLFHMSNLQIGPHSVLKYVPQRGHDFVILFFVLSGYVISATVDRKRAQGLRDYAIDRMARVYSVAIPALILSFILACIFGNIAQELPKLVVNFFYLGQVGLTEIYPFWNQPYWSLCYEVMYYLGFACFVFLKGAKRMLAIIFFVLLAGPKVLVLMPCWLLGVLIYHARDKIKLGLWPALVLAFGFPVLASLILNHLHFGETVRAVMPQLLGEHYKAFAFSNYFLADYVTAIIVAVHMYAMRFVAIQWPQWLEQFIIKGAAMSFTLYLMHLPFVFCIVNLTKVEDRGMLIFLLGFLGIPLLCYLISTFTEARRGSLRQWLGHYLPFKPTTL